MNQKELSELIHNAITMWDYNPMTIIFANELSKEIIKRETVDDTLSRIK